MTDWNEIIQAMNKTDQLIDEITRLRAVEERFSIVVDDYKALHKELIKLHRRLDEAKKVIKPFAEDAPPSKRGEREDTFVYGNISENDLFAARKWMEDKS